MLKKTIEVQTEGGRSIEVGCIGENFYIQIGKAYAELLPAEASEVIGALREVAGANYSPPAPAAKPVRVTRPNTPDFDYPINPQ